MCKTWMLWIGMAFFQQEEPASFKIVQPAPVKAGKEIIASVVFDMQDGWYIYAPTGNNTSQGMLETTLTLQLPKGFRLAGKLRMPQPYFKGPFEVFEGKNIKISQPLTTEAGLKPGTYEISGSILYQTCNSNVCLAPRTEDVKIVVQIK